MAADLTPAAATSKVYSNTVLQIVRGGEVIAFGQPVYKSSSDWRYYKTVSSSVAAAAAKGIAITPCEAAGDYLVIAKKGGLDLGCTLTVGTRYYVSASGGIQAHGDLASGEYITLLGIATTASRLEIDINASGIAVP